MTNIILSKEIAGTYDTHASFVLRDLDAPGDDRLDVYDGSGKDLIGAQQWATVYLAERGIIVNSWTGHIRDTDGRLFEQPYWTTEPGGGW